MPKIYVYTTKTYKKKGWLKVGETKHDVAARIKAQDGTSNPESLDPVGEWECVVGDKEIHAYLSRRRIPRIRNKREWFVCTIEDVVQAVNFFNHGVARSHAFGLRREQMEAVDAAVAFYKEHGRGARFLWNAKMRFGKTFAAYQLMRRLEAKRTLVLTYKTAAKRAWQQDLENHVDFKKFTFVDVKDNPRDKPFDPLAEDIVVFASFQLLQENKGNPGYEVFFSTEWDLLIVDEVHFGAESANAEVMLGKMNICQRLDLSGTPFKLLRSGTVVDDQVFNWTYIDEQKERILEIKRLGEEAPTKGIYYDLPPMSIYTYKMGSKAIKDAGCYEEKEFFTANKFFASEDGLNFVNQAAVEHFLDELHSPNDKTGHNIFYQISEPMSNGSYSKRTEALRHTFWYLPNVNACKAMARTLEKHPSFKDYAVICAAGDNNGEGQDTLELVDRAVLEIDEDKPKGSITLSCGKLNTGVTVPEWIAVLMLNDISSPQDYFQTAFRAQSPWPGGKKHCFVFDFNPNRVLNHIYSYAKELTGNSEASAYEYIESMLATMNVLCYDDGYLSKLNQNDVIDILYTHGQTRSLLAKKFSSDKLINMKALVSVGEKEMAILEKLTQHSNIADVVAAIINKNTIPNGVDKDITKKAKQSEGLSIPKDREKHYNSLKERLKRLCSRLPLFMYLTDEREASIYEVIRVFEPELFEATTGITQEDFRQILEVGLLHKQFLDEAVAGFRRFEEPSLNLRTLVNTTSNNPTKE